MTRCDEIRTKLATTAAAMSGYAPEDISPSASFLALGFDSLFLTQYAAAVQNEFGVDVAFRDLLEETPSLDALAANIDARLPDEAGAAQASTSSTAVAESVAQDQLAQVQVSQTEVAQTPGAPPAAQSSPAPIATPPSATLPPNADGLSAVFELQLQLMREQIALLSGAPERAAAARVGVLDDGAGRSTKTAELGDEFEGGVGVGDIIEGKRLP